MNIKLDHLDKTKCVIYLSNEYFLPGFSKDRNRFEMTIKNIFPFQNVHHLLLLKRAIKLSTLIMSEIIIAVHNGEVTKRMIHSQVKSVNSNITHVEISYGRSK